MRFFSSSAERNGQLRIKGSAINQRPRDPSSRAASAPPVVAKLAKCQACQLFATRSPVLGALSAMTDALSLGPVASNGTSIPRRLIQPRNITCMDHKPLRTSIFLSWLLREPTREAVSTWRCNGQVLRHVIRDTSFATSRLPMPSLSASASYFYLYFFICTLFINFPRGISYRRYFSNTHACVFLPFLSTRLSAFKSHHFSSPSFVYVFVIASDCTPEMIFQIYVTCDTDIHET